ncbi:MAG: nitric oxide synthase [Anaerolineaceae bacterium]|nr:nitric oxide synthase [Anaerolineaceae bacterium]
MKAMVVYDSKFGNTELIARAMGQALGPAADVEVVRVGDVRPGQLAGLDLLIAGSPTWRFRPTPAIKELLDNIPRGGLDGTKVAAFDTRLTPEKIEAMSGFLARMVNIFGFAARPIGRKLEKKGGKPVATPEGFYVEDSEGPLREGELERAADWARQAAARAGEA